MAVSVRDAVARIAVDAPAASTDARRIANLAFDWSTGSAKASSVIESAITNNVGLCLPHTPDHSHLSALYVTGRESVLPSVLYLADPISVTQPLGLGCRPFAALRVGVGGDALHTQRVRAQPRGR